MDTTDEINYGERIAELEKLLQEEKQQNDQLKEENTTIREGKIKAESLNKVILARLQALEMDLGKLKADDFAATFREPIMVVLLEEGEDIMRRFAAGPPGNQEELDAFVEKVRKWIASATKARQGSKTQRTVISQDILRNAFSGK